MLRSHRRSPVKATTRGTAFVDDASDWLTLREASEATGVPADTIRKWARHERIPSFLEKTPDGVLRVVSMRGIEKWADEIGRDLESIDGREDGGGGHEVDLRQDDAEPEEAEVPEGSMIVPLDAWNRMLNQLGNLHEAGQQLAEARERAAKAETEARFLKERLADLRQQLEETREPEASEPVEPAPSSLVTRAYRGWRSMRRRR
jgi:DNA-binding transcriptional MerR regulator